MTNYDIYRDEDQQDLDAFMQEHYDTIGKGTPVVDNTLQEFMSPSVSGGSNTPRAVSARPAVSSKRPHAVTPTLTFVEGTTPTISTPAVETTTSTTSTAAVETTTSTPAVDTTGDSVFIPMEDTETTTSNIDIGNVLSEPRVAALPDDISRDNTSTKVADTPELSTASFVPMDDDVELTLKSGLKGLGKGWMLSSTGLVDTLGQAERLIGNSIEAVTTKNPITDAIISAGDATVKTAKDAKTYWDSIDDADEIATTVGRVLPSMAAPARALPQALLAFAESRGEGNELAGAGMEAAVMGGATAGLNKLVGLLPKGLSMTAAYEHLPSSVRTKLEHIAGLADTTAANLYNDLKVWAEHQDITKLYPEDVVRLSAQSTEMVKDALKTHPELKSQLGKEQFKRVDDAGLFETARAKIVTEGEHPYFTSMRKAGATEEEISAIKRQMGYDSSIHNKVAPLFGEPKIKTEWGQPLPTPKSDLLAAHTKATDAGTYTDWKAVVKDLEDAPPGTYGLTGQEEFIEWPAKSAVPDVDITTGIARPVREHALYGHAYEGSQGLGGKVGAKTSPSEGLATGKPSANIEVPFTPFHAKVLTAKWVMSQLKSLIGNDHVDQAIVNDIVKSISKRQLYRGVKTKEAYLRKITPYIQSALRGRGLGLHDDKKTKTYDTNY